MRRLLLAYAALALLAISGSAASAGPKATGVAAGGFHSCAVTGTGGAKCWGSNQSGELGDGTTSEHHTPVDVSGLTSGVGALTAGFSHTCALTTSSGVKCWGGNLFGQLGDGTSNTRLAPVDVSGLTSGAVAVAAGNSHTCALTNAGGVKCWGNNGSGQLGGCPAPACSSPVDVSGLTSGVAAIATGFAHTCALTSVGGVKCWGLNNYGQLGDGTTTDSSTPVDVSGLTSGVAAIGAGDYHTCAVTTGGGVKCWGFNNYGQLGDGSTTDRPAPTDVSGLAGGMRAVSAGGFHTCALTSSAGIKCWGSNGGGELGDGTTADRHTPVDVVGLASGVAAMAVGYFHTCAVTTAGAGLCWGSNDNGQLGNGTTSANSHPVEVTGLEAPRTLTITKTGSGSGTVQSNPEGIDCGATCSSSFDFGTQVTLSARPRAGVGFAGWSGACHGGRSCVLTISNDSSVTARFVVLKCVVPNVLGQRLPKAKARIVKAHCRVGKVTRRASTAARRGRVLAQSPRAGKRLANGARIKLTVGR